MDATARTETAPTARRMVARQLLRWGGRVIPLGLLASMAVNYFWLATLGGDPFRLHADPKDRYGLLTEALLARQLHLKIAPDPSHLALPDPWDPVASRPFRMPRRTQDASLFEGRFYYYFGLGPVVVLFAPFRLLTGRYLAVILTAGAQLAVVGVLLLLVPGIRFLGSADGTALAREMSSMVAGLAFGGYGAFGLILLLRMSNLLGELGNSPYAVEAPSRWWLLALALPGLHLLALSFVSNRVRRIFAENGLAVGLLGPRTSGSKRRA